MGSAGTVTTTAILSDVMNLGGAFLGAATTTIGTGGLEIGNSTYYQAGVEVLAGASSVIYKSIRNNNCGRVDYG